MIDHCRRGQVETSNAVINGLALPEPEVKILASNGSDQSTTVLGNEFDDSLRGKLMDVLRKLGAVAPHGPNRFVVGSQDFEELDVVIDGRSLHIEAETYVGLSIRVPSDLVEQVRRLVLQ